MFHVISCAKTRLKHLCAINHFRLVHASFIFHSLHANVIDDDENKSFETTPTIRDTRECLEVDKRSFVPCDDRSVAIPGLLLVYKKSLFQLCKREAVLVWMSLLNGSKWFFFFSSCVVNCCIASLSQRSSLGSRLYNERRASVLFGHQDGKQKKFISVLCRLLSIVKINETFRRRKNHNFNVPWKENYFLVFIIKNSARLWTWLQNFEFSRCTLAVWNNWKTTLLIWCLIIASQS